MTIEDAKQYMCTPSKRIFVYLKANGRKHYHALCGRIVGMEDMSILFQDVYGEKTFKFGLNKIVDCRPRAIRTITWKMPKRFVHQRS
jgi:hypothetical protein